MQSLIELIYSTVIGIAIALFVGFSIWAAFPAPAYPEYPHYPQPAYQANGSPTPESATKEEAVQKTYDEKQKKYEKDSEKYGQVVALFSLAAAIIFFVIGLWFVRKNDVIGEGLLLGGVFSSFYALMRSSTGIAESDTTSRIVVFVSASICLAMVLVLAYVKFKDLPKKPARR